MFFKNAGNLFMNFHKYHSVLFPQRYDYAIVTIKIDIFKTIIQEPLNTIVMII
jgi:hypothetical protein